MTLTEDSNEFLRLRDAVGDQVSALWGTLAIFRELFSSGEENRALLAESAEFAFEMIRRSMVEAIILGIGRLTDPPSSAGKRNASLDALLEVAPLDGDARKRLQVIRADLAEQVKLIRDYRNKLIGHRDREVALGKIRLEALSAPEVNTAIEKCSRVLEQVELEIFEMARARDVYVGGSDGAALLTLLKLGLAARVKKPNDSESAATP